MPEDRASRDGLLYLKDEELRSVIRNVPISDVYCVEDTVFARGKFATVRRALHKATGVQYAAKYIKKRRRNVNMVPDIKHEISVLLKCATNNRVVRLYEVYETNSDMVLILGLAAGGELQRIFDGDQCLGEIEARRAMRQILEGLCYLHERNIAHLDLKPQNILLMVEDSCDDIKLCDFGISRLLEPGSEVRTLSGTPDYVAPEVVSYEPISLATDIWSVGVLAYVLLSGYTPFGADTKEQTSLNISKGIVTFEPEDFVDVSSVALDFITSILVLNPAQRPSVKELLQHPWINPQSHILPSLPLKANSDAINVTPKSTPTNHRKSLPCPPEAPPSNNTRTPFNSENLNDIPEAEQQQKEDQHYRIENNNNEIRKNSLQIYEIDIEQNEDEAAACSNGDNYFRNIPHNQDGEAQTPSEVSSEEIEENFFLLKTIEKSPSDEEFPVIESHHEHIDDKQEELRINKITNCFDIFMENKDSGPLSRSFEDIHSDSGIVGSVELETDQSRFSEINNDIEEYSKKNEMASLEEHHEQVSEITINFGVDIDEENDQNSSANGLCTNVIKKDHSTEKVFVNTYEVDKQIIFTLSCATISERNEESTVKESILINPFEIRETFCHDNCAITNHSPVEVLSSNNVSHETEEAEYSQESNKIFVNTYKIKSE